MKRELLLLLDFLQLLSVLSPPKILLMTWLSPFFVMMHSLTKSFPSKMMHLHCHFLLEYSSIFPYHAFDAAL